MINAVRHGSRCKKEQRKDRRKQQDSIFKGKDCSVYKLEIWYLVKVINSPRFVHEILYIYKQIVHSLVQTEMISLPNCGEIYSLAFHVPLTHCFLSLNINSCSFSSCIYQFMYIYIKDKKRKVWSNGDGIIVYNDAFHGRCWCFKSSVSWLPWSHLSIFSTQEIAYTSFWDTWLSNSLTLKKICNLCPWTWNICSFSSGWSRSPTWL